MNLTSLYLLFIQVGKDGVLAMIQRAKSLSSDLSDLEAEFKTHAHRKVTITLRPRGNKGNHPCQACQEALEKMCGHFQFPHLSCSDRNSHLVNIVRTLIVNFYVHCQFKQSRLQIRTDELDRRPPWRSRRAWPSRSSFPPQSQPNPPR